MSWIEVVIDVPRNHAEALSDALMDTEGALSVTIEDADEGTDEEQPLFGEPGMEPEQAAWEHSRVIVLMDADSDHAALVATAVEACRLDSETNTNMRYTTRIVAEEDWVRLTQSQFAPIHIGKNIWVVPSWHDAPNPAALVLELDPGLAFGTGSHPTTRLCMEWLEACPLQGLSVLDYGCGSGILAIIAKKLGATEVAGIDIDPQAIASARYNSERNHCKVNYYLPEEFDRTEQSKTFDVVVANILTGPLKLMAPMLSGRVASGGALVLSGVLARQANEVIAAYANFIQLQVCAEHDGWVVLSGQRLNIVQKT